MIQEVELFIEKFLIFQEYLSEDSGGLFLPFQRRMECFGES